MDVLTQRISLLLSETQASNYGDHDEADAWSSDDYDEDDEDWLTLDLQFLETAARTAKRDSRKAQIVLGLITDGKKIQEWSPLNGSRGRQASLAPLGRMRSRSEERPLLRRRDVSHEILGNNPTGHERNASVELAKPVSFAAHRHSVTLVDTVGPSRNSGTFRQPTALALGTPRPSMERELHSARILTSRSGKRDSGSGFVNFSRPLSVSIASPNPTDRPSLDRPRVAVTPILIGPKPAPEDIIDPISTLRLTTESAREVVRDDIGLPRTPTHNTLRVAQPIFQRVPPARVDGPRKLSKTDMDIHPYQRHKRARGGSLWSSLPVCGLVSICQKPHMRLLDEEESRPRPQMRQKSEHEKIKLTEDNLRRWEQEIGYARKPINRNALPEPLRMSNNNGSRSKLPAATLDKRLPTPPKSPPVDTPGMSQTVNRTSDPPPAPPPKDNFAPFYQHPNMPVQLPTPTCMICNEAKALSQFSVRQCTRKCTHPPHTCRTCVERWIEIRLDDQGSAGLACPECGEGMEWEDVRFFANTATFERYDELLTRSTLYQIDAFFWCLSPHCQSGQIQPSPLSDHPTFVCASCTHIYCLNHPSLPYHAGLSCPEYDSLLNYTTPSIAITNWMQQVDLDKAVQEKMELQRARLNKQKEKEGEKTVQEVGKRCPNALCGWWIEKSEGCDRMVCLKCRFEFCWECGAPWGVIEKKGHLFHREGCKYWG